ncbi:Glu/Leu/Phe/Val dehydrogenase [Conexibacter sp. DBS9H8]|uniref:Glu/Leu/Phe/Val family dehydrogenase n=1 Tax=Conexibacter sp. DBS9H8 TaxID=2937801 RepID=UPI00200C0C0D|nr:Glu/Leu/Phe/Val dehydrogenase dimerization domain-containing protein [Conexibacter sp. DBS9H8]
MEPIEHEEAIIRRGTRSGLDTIVAVHSTRRGPSLGGCRMWHYPDTARALDDALRLSRAMTFKSAVAGLPLGGGKSVIVLPEGEEISPKRRRDALLDIGDTIDVLRGRYITAEDVGTSSRDMSVIATRTRHVAGLSRQKGGSGDPSPFTAAGVVNAIRAALARSFGSSSLEGRRIAIIGAGHVGGRIAKLCAKEGAKLILADVDASKRELAVELGARWMTPAKALVAKVDVVSPCALGGILTEETVARLQCRVIAGAANNQLAGDHIAELLKIRGILWAPDFVANAGGIINIAQERGGVYDAAAAHRAVAGIADTIHRICDTAEADDTTTLAAAMTLARAALDPATVPA